MRKICVVTASRAEYGLLKPLMDLIQESEDFELQIIATGTHLSPEFGLTYKQIDLDGFNINEKVEILLSADTASSIVKTMGVAMLSLADILPRLNPDLLIVLGDRYEMLAIASSAIILKIPIAHIHGGEVTEGAYDDTIRHAITKMSNLHFASTESYRNRIIQMGEYPDCVFNVGAIGLDSIRNLELLTKDELEKELDFKFKKYTYKVAFHPETLGEVSAKEQFQNLLTVIKEQKDSFFIFTKTNADTDGRVINQMIDHFVNNNPDCALAITSLGTLRFLSIVKHCDAIIGNSSSGIIEAPSLKTATLNIGNRQKGRIQAGSIINIGSSIEEIREGFKVIIEPEFQKKVLTVINPYDKGGAANEIFKIIKNNKDSFTYKRFYNL
jgi:UDP-hydrolysing UDP-N-acetyl-D-glucosamine 2-epimerase